MKSNAKVVFLFVILGFNFINHVSSVINTAILKKDDQTPYHVVGNGVFISGLYVACPLDCFLDDNGHLITEATFGVFFHGATGNDVLIDIVDMSTHKAYVGTWDRNNIAVLRLPDWQSLNINVDRNNISFIELYPDTAVGGTGIMRGFSPNDFQDFSYPFETSTVYDNIKYEVSDMSLEEVSATILTRNTLCSLTQPRSIPNFRGQLRHEVGIPILFMNNILGLTTAKYWQDNRVCYNYVMLSDHLMLINSVMRKSARAGTFTYVYGLS